jgi:hypothetical protein
MEYPRLALILDEEAGPIGELALQLVRLGVNVLYTNDLDESVLLARQAADNVGAVVVPSHRAIEWLPRIPKRLPLPASALVPAGEQADDATLEALRDEGVRWVLWLPDDERAVRFVVAAAMSETDATEIRFDLRVPTKLQGKIQRGSLDRPCEVLNLSEGGALVAVEPLMPVGSRIALHLDLGDESLSLSARVAWSTESTEPHPAEGNSMMGVQFEDADPEARGALGRFLERRIQRFRL